jgi:ppGpp synthetase/RelA/SpoT-type nucleotidyltranferase
MTFDDYVSGRRTLYELLGTIVESVLAAALRQRPDIRLQQTQHRAKSTSSLRRKLKRDGHLDANDIEEHAKDLAGCRLIFYTNSDASKFLNSGIIRENFEVDWDRSKIHHPTSESTAASEQFVSNNYVVRLKENRAALPEYTAVSGLWCEVQVQTTLNHAWAELAHDTIYQKPDLPKGFGTSLMQDIEQRMKAIMRKFILPAGYDFEKVLIDSERLSNGRELFEKGIINAIAECDENNARFELLERFSTYVLPYYDDVGAAYADAVEAARRVVADARVGKDVTIDTPFGSYAGHTGPQVISKAADILDRVRYLDINRTFSVLLEIFKSTADDEERNRWKQSGEELAKHDLDVWEKAGPTIQLRLLSLIKRLKSDDKQSCRGLLVAMLRKMLDVEISGTTAHLDTVTFRRGAIPLSAAVLRMRRDAIRLLKLFVLSASTDDQKREALSALHDGTRLLGQNGADESARAAVLQQSRGIVEFYREIASMMSNELRSKMENKTLWLYRHIALPSAVSDHTADSLAKLELRQEILKFRDEINKDERFVTFKTLVGYESVFAPSWDDDEFDISRIDEFRSRRIDEFVTKITKKNFVYWAEIIRECASVQSNDGATFPKFSEFLEKLARQKPNLALEAFDGEQELLSKFLPSLLKGWEESNDGPDVIELRRRWVSEGKFLAPIVWSFRFDAALDVPVLTEALERAITSQDHHALWNMVTVADVRNDDAEDGLVDQLFIPSIRGLSDLGEYQWPRAIWGGRGSALKNLTKTQAKAILNTLVPAPRLDWDDEEVLTTIAASHCDLVVNFFSARLARDRKPASRYDAIPFDFSTLNEQLIQSSEYVMDMARDWYSRDQKTLFMFRGGKFVANVFKNDWPRLEQELNRFVTDDHEDLDFVLQILRAYEGEEFLHPLLKQIVAQLDPDSEALNEVQIVLESSGVISGEFGFVELHQQRRDLMKKWLDDERPRVVEFARKQIRALENQMAAEQRRAEADYELRKREWGAGDDAETLE